MKILAYKWNGSLTSNGWQMATVTLIVTTRMIQNVIAKSELKVWKIKHLGWHGLSNRQRVCSTMSISLPLNFMHDLLERLEIGWVERDGTIDFYRAKFESNKPTYNAPKFMQYNANTHLHRLVNNTPEVINGTFLKSGKTLYKRIA